MSMHAGKPLRDARETNRCWDQWRSMVVQRRLERTAGWSLLEKLWVDAEIKKGGLKSLFVFFRLTLGCVIFPHMEHSANREQEEQPHCMWMKYDVVVVKLINIVLMCAK